MGCYLWHIETYKFWVSHWIPNHEWSNRVPTAHPTRGPGSVPSMKSSKTGKGEPPVPTSTSTSSPTNKAAESPTPLPTLGPLSLPSSAPSSLKLGHNLKRGNKVKVRSSMGVQVGIESMKNNVEKEDWCGNIARYSTRRQTIQSCSALCFYKVW